jgi:hypothetical protein
MSLRNKKYLFLLSGIIALLFVIDIYIVYHYYRLQQKTKIIQRQLVVDSDELNLLKVNFNYSFTNNNILLSDVVMKDFANNMVLLKNKFKPTQKYFLICRFSEYQCESCIKSAISILYRFSNSIGMDNVILLGTYQNNRIFNQQKATYDIHDFQVYNTASVNLPIDKVNYPYYFILDNELRVSDVFMPDKAIPTLTREYLLLITKRYFQEESQNIQIKSPDK